LNASLWYGVIAPRRSLKGKYRWGCDARVVSGGLREGFEGDFVAEAFELGD
jgi:hypothetical protein